MTERSSRPFPAFAGLSPAPAAHRFHFNAGMLALFFGIPFAARYRLA